MPKGLLSKLKQSKKVPINRCSEDLNIEEPSEISTTNSAKTDSACESGDRDQAVQSEIGERMEGILISSKAGDSHSLMTPSAIWSGCDAIIATKVYQIAFLVPIESQIKQNVGAYVPPYLPVCLATYLSPN